MILNKTYALVDIHHWFVNVRKLIECFYYTSLFHYQQEKQFSWWRNSYYCLSTIDNDFLQLNQRILWHKVFMTCLHNRLCKILNYCKSTFQFNELFDFSDRFHKWATKVEGQKNLNYFSFSIWKTTLFSK